MCNKGGIGATSLAVQPENVHLLSSRRIRVRRVVLLLHPQVLTGGWDQNQFRYWGNQMKDSINSHQLGLSSVSRSQNRFSSLLISREKKQIDR